LARSGRGDKVNEMNQVLCLGEALVDLVSMEPGRAMEDTRAYRLAPGGAVCNVAVGLARLGVKVGLITKLGADPLGQFMLDFLKKEKVDTTWIKAAKNELTALVFVALDKKRNPSFFFYGTPGADRKLLPRELSARAFRGVKVFHFGTISLSLEPVRSATLHAIELAQKAGCVLSFDPNFRFHLWKDHRALKKITWSLIPKVALLKLSEDELVFLTDTKNLEKGAEKLIKNGAKIVAVTLGAKGAFYATEKYHGYAPGFKLQPVDTTGAGDAFTAGMIAWLIRFKTIPPEKNELITAVRFANAFAGLSTLKLGAIEGLANWEKVERHIKRDSRHFA